MKTRTNTPSGVTQYLTAIGKIPLLSDAEEVETAQIIQRWIAYRDEYTGKDSLPQDWEFVKRQGERAINKMIESNLRLVVKVAKKFSPYRKTMDLLDLVQEGSIGLREAAERFDPTKGWKFSTYAYWWIRQAIGRSIPEQDESIRIPCHIAEKSGRVRRAIHSLKQRGIKVSAEAIAIEAEMSVASVESVYRSWSVQPISLNVRVGEDQDTERIELIAAEGEDLLDILAEKELIEQQRNRLEVVMGELNPQERRVLHLRCLSDSPKSLEASGKILGISRTSVSAIESRVKRKIKGQLIRQNIPTVEMSTYVVGQARIRNTALQILIDANRILSKQALSDLLMDSLDIDPKNEKIRRSIDTVIRELREQGHPIITVRGKGYRYGNPDVLDTLPDSLAEIVEQLRDCHDFDTGKRISDVAIAINPNGGNLHLHNVCTKFSQLKNKIGDRLQRGGNKYDGGYRYWLTKQDIPRESK